MKRNETKKALADKSPAELQTELEALLREQFGLRMQKATQQLTNTPKLKGVRRDIARVRTRLDPKTSKAPGKQGARGKKSMIERTGNAAAAGATAPRRASPDADP